MWSRRCLWHWLVHSSSSNSDDRRLLGRIPRWRFRCPIVIVLFVVQSLDLGLGRIDGCVFRDVNDRNDPRGDCLGNSRRCWYRLSKDRLSKDRSSPWNLHVSGGYCIGRVVSMSCSILAVLLSKILLLLLILLLLKLQVLFLTEVDRVLRLMLEIRVVIIIVQAMVAVGIVPSWADGL